MCFTESINIRKFMMKQMSMQRHTWSFFGAGCVLSGDVKSNHLLYYNIFSGILGP